MEIGILATEINDAFVHKLGQWIFYLGHKPVIIYENDIVNNRALNIDLNEENIGVTLITSEGIEIDFDSVNVFYRRSWHHGLSFPENEEDFYCKKEVFAIRNLILDRINTSGKLIGHCEPSALLKMKHLLLAKKNGFTIPNSKIVTNKEQLKASTSYITKAIDAVYLKQEENSILTNYTQTICTEELPEDFFPALIQEQVKGKIELRAFVFIDTIYCVAYINKNEDEEIDNRVLIAARKTESYPFLLSSKIKSKILRIMEALNIQMCSIEFILSDSGDYVFLDLNPFGQIGMTSFSVFPHIEKDIAEKLVDYGQKKKSVGGVV